MAQTETTLRILLLEGNDRQREALAVSTGQPDVELLCPPPNASLLQQIGEASPGIFSWMATSWTAPAIRC